MDNKLPERRMKSKSEQIAEDLEKDLMSETKSINLERSSKGKKPIEIEISLSRHKEHR